MVPLHEAAQDVAWFAVFMYLLIGVVLLRDIRKERKSEREDGKRNSR